MKVATLVFCFICFALASWGQLSINSPAPEIKLPDTAGKWAPLSEVHSKLILLDFWAAWCSPCVQSMPDLKRIHKTYHDKGLTVYAVSLDKNYYKWVNMCRTLELPFVLVNEAYGFDGKSCKDYNISSIPSKMLLKNGQVIASNMSLYDLEKIIEKELNASSDSNKK